MKPIKEIWNQLVAIRTKQDILHFLESVEDSLKILFSSIEVQSIWANAGLAVTRTLVGVMLFSNVFREKIGLPLVVSGEIKLPERIILPEWLGWVNDDRLQLLEKMDSWVGAGMMVTGFSTRLMALSYLWSSLSQSFSGSLSSEWSLYYFAFFLAVSMSAIILGSGKIGFDYIIVKWFRNRKRKKKESKIRNSF